MKVLIALKGTEGQTFVARVIDLLDLRGADKILLTTVVDRERRRGLEMGRDRYLGRRPLGRERADDLERIEEDVARAALRQAREWLVIAGAPDDRVREIVLHGAPNEELRHLAEREGVDLLVVAARPGTPGPHSLGKTARFLVDHAPHSALLVR
jgi:nucleotide-binding universal stress UspA family protein